MAMEIGGQRGGNPAVSRSRGVGIGHGWRYSAYLRSAPTRENLVRLRSGYVTALRANIFRQRGKNKD